jgi:hypothetical protein
MAVSLSLNGLGLRLFAHTPDALAISPAFRRFETADDRG